MTGIPERLGAARYKEPIYLFSLYWAQVTDKEVKGLPLSPCVAMDKKKLTRYNQNTLQRKIMLTVTIKPAVAYANGKRAIATQFNVKSLNDDLHSNVTFLYTLLDEHGVWCGESTTALEGRENYIKWDATASGAYTIVAEAIGLEIVPTVGAMFDFEA